MDGSQARSTEELRRLLRERTADLQRVKAEYDNYRKRVRRDRLAVRRIAVANVLTALLPVLDAVDRARAHEPMTPGLKDIADTLESRTGGLGLVAFGEVGDEFDPARHDALAHHVSEDADRLVCTAVLRPGYRIGDQLLRPAQVEVTGPRWTPGTPSAPAPARPSEPARSPARALFPRPPSPPGPAASPRPLRSPEPLASPGSPPSPPSLPPPQPRPSLKPSESPKPTGAPGSPGPSEPPGGDRR
ncbi:nucleotide exchange factor GrpE [Streptomyces sp. NPDC051041]|uniref:nucleotide exchange factor GrpE n=1 Tax=Streptomyces sp. NPDC051041 TaxID=3365640 RepID=UPI0037AFEF4E